MIRSVRNPLIAATVAVVGAGAIAAQPAARPGQVFTDVPVALSAFLNPVTQFLATGEVTQNYLFGAYYNGGDAPTPGAGEANWTDAGFDQTGGDLLNYLLYTQASLGYYNFVGLAPNSTANAGPVLRALQTNWADYINVGLTGLNSAAVAISDGIWDYPSALLTAAQLALAGQIPQALSVLTDAVFGPITAAGEALLSAGTYVLSNVVAHIGAVVAALPQIFTNFAGTAIGGAAIYAEQAAALATAWVSELAALDIEGAWNVAVAGWLGPTGLPGTTLNITTGAGIQTGPILDPATDIPGNFVPSWRTSFQAALWSVADALQTSPAPAAATPAAAVRAAKPAAAAVRSTVANDDATESDSAAESSASSSSAPSLSDLTPSAVSGRADTSGKTADPRGRSARAGADRTAG